MLGQSKLKEVVQRKEGGEPLQLYLFECVKVGQQTHQRCHVVAVQVGAALAQLLGQVWTDCMVGGLIPASSPNFLVTP